MWKVLRALLFAGLVSTAISTAIVPANAQTAERDPEGAAGKARGLKARGNEAMAKGRPADALAMYRAAYEAEPSAALLYNMGRAFQALADYPEALVYLTRFEQEADEQLKRRVPNLDALIAEVKGRVATVKIVCNVDGATVRLGDRRLGTSPLQPVQVNAGKFTLEVSSDRHLPYEEKIELKGGESVVIKVKLDSKETHGLLEVRSPEPNVRVLVDKKMRGMVPLELRLPAGTHWVELRKEGFESVSTTAVVQAGKRKEVTIEIEEKPELYERWWFWTGIGVVVAGTVTAVIVSGKEKDSEMGTIPPGQISAGLHF